MHCVHSRAEYFSGTLLLLLLLLLNGLHALAAYFEGVQVRIKLLRKCPSTRLLLINANELCYLLVAPWHLHECNHTHSSCMSL